jgi:hypothetical protein
MRCAASARLIRSSSLQSRSTFPISMKEVYNTIFPTRSHLS